MVSTINSKSRAWVEIDLSALVTNAETIQRTARGAQLLPMVKADAYGLGVEQVVGVLEALDPWGYGVATVDEGVQLRSIGVKRAVLVLCPASLELQNAYRSYDLTAVLDSPEVASRWQGPFHLEIDTGMSRTGVRWDSPDLASFDSARLEGLFTHFHSADERADSIGVQLERFALATAPFDGGVLRHVANSAAVFSIQEHFDMVRPGVFLYGGPTRPDLPHPLSVVSLKARVVSLRTVREGDTVSYGGEWRAGKDTDIATLGIGFGDGVSRAFAGNGEVLVAGRRHPVVGRVTMDLMMIDITGAGPGAISVGSTSVLVGRDGPDEISLAEYAGNCGTSTYEALTRLRGRLPRTYLKEVK